MRLCSTDLRLCLKFEANERIRLDRSWEGARLFAVDAEKQFRKVRDPQYRRFLLLTAMGYNHKEIAKITATPLRTVGRLAKECP